LSEELLETMAAAASWFPAASGYGDQIVTTSPGMVRGFGKQFGVRN
jgi:hypothetical protein